MNRNLIFLLFFSLLMAHPLYGQIHPIAYWSFDGPADQLRASKFGKAEIQGGKGLEFIPADGVSGGFLRASDEGESFSYLSEINPESAITLEFWFRIPAYHYREKFTILSLTDRSIGISFQFPRLLFMTNTLDQNHQAHEDIWPIDLKGSGKNGYGYYMDGNWHHMVVMFDAGRGKKEIWIDGELPAGFTKTLEVRGKLCQREDCQRKLQFSRHLKYRDNYLGDLDELAIYYRQIPGTLIARHYQEGREGKVYDFNNVKGFLATQLPKTSAQLDQQEYVPGHPTPGIPAQEQLAQFPLPRYHPAHKLHRLYNWMEADYLGGHRQPGITREQVGQNSYEIQKELALHWNYFIIFHNARFVTRSNSPEVDGWIRLANEHPEIPFGVTTLWDQVYYEAGNGKLDRAYVRSQKLPEAYYIQDASGNFASRGNGRKYLSPAAPLDLLEEDGQKQGSYLSLIQSRLTRPIDAINENGEMPFHRLSEEFMAADPTLVKDKAASSLQDWDDYQALRKTQQRQAYRNAMLQSTKLEGVAFSWYGVDGGPLDRFSWSYAREIQSPQVGQYYSTADFYPRVPDNWYKWQGAWRGWRWLEACRKVEIAAGDRLFSPFVSPGWDHRPENNIRPSQYLGLLKCLGVIGAEYYFPGFFNVGKQVADPKNYIWQAALPAYAQAITSRYEYILREGDLLLDGTGEPIVRTWAGNPMILATVRKHPDKPIYIVSTTLQPLANGKGIVPDQEVAILDLEETLVRLISRRQGSTYYLDLQSSSEPVVYQMDTWHQTGHPAYWKKDFEFEAEVYDYLQGGLIKTEFPAEREKGDFTKFTSYLHLQGDEACAKYEFHPREIGTYQVKITGRKGNNSAAKVQVLLDGETIGDPITLHTDWKEFSLRQPLKDVSNTSHTLTLKTISGICEIDHLQLVKQ